MSSKAVGILIVLLVIGTSFYFLRTSQNSEELRTATISRRFEIGEPAPIFETIDFDGNTFSLTQVAGSPVIIDFWAGWCAFCVEEMPILQKLHEEHNDIAIVGIHRTDSGESLEDARRFAQREGVSYMLLQDQAGTLYDAASHGQSVMPVALFLDADHTVIDIKWGAKTEFELRKKVLEIQNL